jgi:hypothetical protein
MNLTIEAGMNIIRDLYVILWAVLLLMTLGAYLLGMIFYPVGILLFAVLLVMRIRKLREAK